MDLLRMDSLRITFVPNWIYSEWICSEYIFATTGFAHKAMDLLKKYDEPSVTWQTAKLKRNSDLTGIVQCHAN
jgi:hypothetical protein